MSRRFSWVIGSMFLSLGLAACVDPNTIQSMYDRGKTLPTLFKVGGASETTTAERAAVFKEERKAVIEYCNAVAYQQAPVAATSVQTVAPSYSPVQTSCYDYGFGMTSNIMCTSSGGYNPGVSSTLDVNSSARVAYRLACYRQQGWYVYETPPCPKGTVVEDGVRIPSLLRNAQEQSKFGTCYLPLPGDRSIDITLR